MSLPGPDGAPPLRPRSPQEQPWLGLSLLEVGAAVPPSTAGGGGQLRPAFPDPCPGRVPVSGGSGAGRGGEQRAPPASAPVLGGRRGLLCSPLPPSSPPVGSSHKSDLPPLGLLFCAPRSAPRKQTQRQNAWLTAIRLSSRARLSAVPACAVTSHRLKSPRLLERERKDGEGPRFLLPSPPEPCSLPCSEGPAPAGVRVGWAPF